VAADTTVTISGSYGATKTASLTITRSLTLSLDNGSGPFYTNQNTVAIRGHVAPASAAPGTTVTGTLGAQTVTTTAVSDGSFTLPLLTLTVGPNAVSVTALNSATGQSAGPATATYVYDNVAPDARVVLATQVPSPTNIPTWTLSGTISDYQGPTENAYVYLNDGSTRYPIASDGTWSGAYTFIEGANSIRFAVADLAGNYYNIEALWFYLDTQGLEPLFTIGMEASGTFGWPVMLDEVMAEDISFYAETSPLNGSHIDLYFDEPGSFPATSPTGCAPDNLSCLVTRKAVPDMAVDFTTSQAVRLIPLSPGVHTMRMVLRDPFGVSHERGALLLVGWQSNQASPNGDEYATWIPVANFSVPGTVTTQTPKLGGRVVTGIAPLDCNDEPGDRLPTFSYWDPGQGGSWKGLSLKSSSVSGGVYEAVPSSRIPITTNAAGQQVLRISLKQGVYGGYYDPYWKETVGRNICNGETVVTDVLRKQAIYWGPQADGGVNYDLSYRSSAHGDDPAPQIDLSAVHDVATDTADTYTLQIRLRVTDLDGDLDYRNVTVSTAGCSSPDCTYTGRLAGDQALTSAQPGGYFAVDVPLAVGANNLVGTARDDAGHVTNQNFTVNRNLTAVAAVITSPAAAGQIYPFCAPQAITFDASSSFNRTNPPVPLRYQWTTTGYGYVLKSNSAIYTETIQYSESRRVIVSSSANPAPDPTSGSPCASAPPGQCSVAVVTLQPFSVPGGTLPVQLLSPTGGASVRVDVPVALSGTVGSDADPRYVYKWTLKRTSDNVNVTIPQATGTGSDPSYAFSNRSLTLRLDSLAGLTAGNYTLTFNAAYETTPGSCTAQQSSASTGITVTTKQYYATGLAPGTVVVGEGSTRLYGSSFDSAAQVAISGPIYTLDNTTTPLCTMPSCPQVFVAATASVDGKTLDFPTPVSLNPGYYLVFAADPATGATSGAIWLEVHAALEAAPAKTQQFSSVVRPLVAGQSVTGQFLAGRDTSLQFSDVDYYYFFAASGSTLSLSLSRTDTSLPWEAPDALDPQLTVVDPDGLIDQGFEVLDNQPGVDLNASLTNLVLPKTGRYIVYAATSKGFGPYQLSFALTPAAPASARQVLPAANNDRTVPLNTAGFKPSAFVLDKRGYALSGAVTQFAATPESNETGAVSFPSGATIATSPQGFAQVDARLTAAGKISFQATLQNAGLVASQAPETASIALVPSYPAIASVMPEDVGLDPVTGEMQIRFGRIQRVDSGRPQRPVVRFKTKDGKRFAQPGALGPESVRQPKVPGIAATAPGSAHGVGLAPEAITTCSPAQFRAAGVNAAAVAGPFTVTMTDLTPKTGQSSGTEVIGADGIHAHRVQRTIRLKIGIKDSTGVEPTYPVLVHLSVFGIAPGSLILDPDGARITCQTASFLWHERDAQGNPAALNEEFEYQLGTYSGFAGVKPDPGTPGAVVPVWGTTEFLYVFFGTFDATDGTLTNQYSAYLGVHPESGPAHHFKWNPRALLPAHQDQYLSAYDENIGSEASTFTNNSGFGNEYYLADVFDNVIYGYTATSATNPAPNILVSFSDQETSSDPADDPEGYQLLLNWNDNPSGASPKTSSQWPSGAYVSTLTISGTDPETGPFTISQNYMAVFSTATFYSLVWVTAYEDPYDLTVDTSVFPPVPITYVSPGAARTRLNGELSRNSILLITGTKLPRAPNFPTFFEGGQGDPMIVTDGLDSFDVSLMDVKGNPVTDGEFQISLCPVLDHRSGPTWGQVDTRPCPPNLVSSNGVIPSVTPIDRGYMGLMVSRAPSSPGIYFFLIKPSPSNTRAWRTGPSLNPLFIYNYAVTVEGADILDENYQRVNPLVVRQAKQGYVRLLDVSETGSAQDLTVQAFDDEGVALGTGVPVTATRVGSSSVFLAPITLLPDGDTLPQGIHTATVQAVRTGGPTRTMPGGRSTLKISQGTTEKGRKVGVVPYQFKIDFANPSNNAVSEQYTVVEDKAHNYAEKTYLLMTVRNPHKNNAIVTNLNGCGFIQERSIPAQVPPTVFSGPRNPGPMGAADTNAAHGGDLLYSPDVNPESQPGLQFNITQGVSNGRDGEGAFFVRAVARYRENENRSARLSSFQASIQATSPISPCKTAGIVDSSDIKAVDMWVDETDFFPLAQGPVPHAARQPAVSIDWIEKQAADLFTDPARNVRQDDQVATLAVLDIVTDVAGDDPHYTGQAITLIGTPASNSPSAFAYSTPPRPFADTQYRIHINPTDPNGFRWSTQDEMVTAPFPFAYPGAGFTYSWSTGPRGRFENILTHERRHALQFRSMSDPAGDADNDGFPTVSSWGGVSLLRLNDSRNGRKGGSNSEFDLFDGVLNGRILKPAIERDALRLQWNTTQLDSVATDVSPVGGPISMPQNFTRWFQVGTVQTSTGGDTSGVMVHATVSGGCVFSEPGGGTSTDTLLPTEDGSVFAHVSSPGAATQCVVSLSLIRPAGFDYPESEGGPHGVTISVE
jgi:hypothetical protein